jgi:arylsulfatase A-like enzyme
MSKPHVSSKNESTQESDQWTRREAVKAMGAAGLAGLAPQWSSAQSSSSSPPSGNPPEHPNILFILTDDHAVRGLSCYGGELMETPNLDRIADEGMRFDNAFVTNSLCAPSRASMLTGKYSHKHGVTENIFGDKEPFDNSQMTFPKRLQEAGYTTLQVGKWHLESDPTGFDYWKRLPNQGRYNDPLFLEKPKNGDAPTRIEEEGYVTDIITRDTIEAIQQHRGDRPFCMLSWHKAPHRGWIPDEEHEDLLNDAPLPPPATFNDDYFARASPATHARMSIANMPDWKDDQPDDLSETERKHWNYQRYMKEYLRTVAALDQEVGRLLEYLDEAGLAENTIVVYATDNGMFIGEHGYYDKRFMYEESIRIPFLVRYPPMIDGGSVEERVVRNIDLAPTFMDLAGADIPEGVQGRSLRPLLEGRDEPDWDEPLYYHYYEYPGPHHVRPHYGVRTERYKLIYYYTVEEWELFDLQRDPNELRNVVDAPRYASVRQELKEELRSLRARYDDTTGKDVPA